MKGHGITWALCVPTFWRNGGPFHSATIKALHCLSDTHWGTIYDAAQLAANEVPLRCAVYFDDMYVDSSLQLDTLSRVGNSHAWVTNRYEHDGARASADVFAHLYQEAMDHGDLDRQRQ